MITDINKTKNGDWFQFNLGLLTKAGWQLTWDEDSDIAYLTHAGTGKIVELMDFNNSAGECAQHAIEQIERISKRS